MGSPRQVAMNLTPPTVAAAARTRSGVCNPLPRLFVRLPDGTFLRVRLCV